MQCSEIVIVFSALCGQQKTQIIFAEICKCDIRDCVCGGGAGVLFCFLHRWQTVQSFSNMWLGQPNLIISITYGLWNWYSVRVKRINELAESWEVLSSCLISAITPQDILGKPLVSLKCGNHNTDLIYRAVVRITNIMYVECSEHSTEPCKC